MKFAITLALLFVLAMAIGSEATFLKHKKFFYKPYYAPSYIPSYYTPHYQPYYGYGG